MKHTLNFKNYKTKIRKVNGRYYMDVFYIDRNKDSHYIYDNEFRFSESLKRKLRALKKFCDSRLNNHSSIAGNRVLNYLNAA